MRWNVAVYAICKNEEAFVDRWMDSMGEADLVVVTDTGSDDHTIEKLRARGAQVFSETIPPWRFDEARNRSLTHVPKDVDICVCTDLDEVFRPGWREKLEQAWRSDTSNGRYLYNWSLKSDGSPDMQFVYAKIHARNGYRWRYPVHEYIEWTRPEPERKVFLDGVVLDHHPDPAKSRGSYLTLLETAVREDPQSERMRYYLGREYLYAGRWDACISTLKAYLELPSSTWAEERAAAMRWIAKAHWQLGAHSEAYQWYYRAMGEAPWMRDAYVECAQMAYALEDWHKVFFLTEEALQISGRSQNYVNMGYSWDETPDDLCVIACYRLGMFARAAEHAKKALAFAPQNSRLQNNLRLIKDRMSKPDAKKKQL
ncbi:MAG: glycosyl transferase family 2 [Ethanoligenens sp.]